MGSDFTIQTKTKGLNIALWVAQSILALTLIWVAYSKLLQPIEETAKMLPWALESPWLLKLTGLLDLLGGIGIILPAALRIQPRLSIFAAYGIIALMISASLFHIARGESSHIGMNIFLLLLALLVAWGRTKKAPISSK